MAQSGYPYRIFLLALITIFLVSGKSAYSDGKNSHQFQGTSFALYVLSRGKGVPDDAWHVFEEMREFISSQQDKGEAIQVYETVIGLEGERRICVNFLDQAAARKAWEHVDKIITGIELVNLRAEACIP